MIFALCHYNAPDTVQYLLLDHFSYTWHGSMDASVGQSTTLVNLNSYHMDWH